MKQKLEQLRKEYSDICSYGENVRKWFSSPTVFGENDVMYDKALSSDLYIAVAENGPFNEANFYRNTSKPTPIISNFVIRFCRYSPMFVLDKKILFPNKDFDQPQIMQLSDILLELQQDGFTDITILDHSCFSYADIDYGTEEWKAANQNYECVRARLPGQKCGGSNGKRHTRTRKRGRVRRRQTRRRRSQRQRQRQRRNRTKKR
jgi:hypothetical protein